MHRVKMAERKQTKLPSEIDLKLVFEEIKIDKTVPNLIILNDTWPENQTDCFFCKIEADKIGWQPAIDAGCHCFRYEFRLADLVMWHSATWLELQVNYGKVRKCYEIGYSIS